MDREALGVPGLAVGAEVAGEAGGVDFEALGLELLLSGEDGRLLLGERGGEGALVCVSWLSCMGGGNQLDDGEKAPWRRASWKEGVLEGLRKEFHEA